MWELFRIIVAERQRCQIEPALQVLRACMASWIAARPAIPFLPWFSMRVLHTSDWHLGQNFIGQTGQAEYQTFLVWSIA
ncbi:hypothetical protein [Chromobacterium sphagni]|uniref:Uncharacterized protein n=1 Tax=Chromobacterium sphagni TaxID=1903179 RepID=A0ABX3C7M3_9NEIS|nr:hypothetical protein [Chromobacterium sphagni]OHX16394.1 hypothetical protein BI344_21570 [Chromobacterium sphagni]